MVRVYVQPYLLHSFLGITFQNSGTREVVFTLGTTPVAGSEFSCSLFANEVLSIANGTCLVSMKISQLPYL